MGMKMKLTIKTRTGLMHSVGRVARIKSNVTGFNDKLDKETHMHGSKAHFIILRKNFILEIFRALFLL